MKVFYQPLRALFVEPLIININSFQNEEMKSSSPRADGLAVKEKKFIVTEYHLKTIFCNIEEILEIHRSLLASLRKVMENWSETQTIGSIFVDMVVVFVFFFFFPIFDNLLLNFKGWITYDWILHKILQQLWYRNWNIWHVDGKEFPFQKLHWGKKKKKKKEKKKKKKRKKENTHIHSDGFRKFSL